MHGPDGHIRSANRLACALLGQDARSLRGTASTAAVWHFVRPNREPIGPDDFPVNVVLRTRARVSQRIVGVCGAGHECCAG